MQWKNWIAGGDKSGQAILSNKATPLLGIEFRPNNNFGPLSRVIGLVPATYASPDASLPNNKLQTMCFNLATKWTSGRRAPLWQRIRLIDGLRAMAEKWLEGRSETKVGAGATACPGSASQAAA